jgi:hypothetical protein
LRRACGLARYFSNRRDWRRGRGHRRSFVTDWTRSLRESRRWRTLVSDAKTSKSGAGPSGSER